MGDGPDAPLDLGQRAWLKPAVKWADLITPWFTLALVLVLLGVFAYVRQGSELVAAGVAVVPLALGGFLLDG